MSDQDYTAVFTVDQSREAVYDAVTDVRGWWSQAIEGDTRQLGSVFFLYNKPFHLATFKITEAVPGKKIVWRVLHNTFNFVKDATEWTDNDIVFEIARKGGQTELRFTQIGLVPAYECFDVCSDAWGSYIKKSLRDLIVTGKGQPQHIDEIVARVEEMSLGRDHSS